MKNEYLIVVLGVIYYIFFYKKEDKVLRDLSEFKSGFDVNGDPIEIKYISGNAFSNIYANLFV